MRYYNYRFQLAESIQLNQDEIRTKLTIALSAFPKTILHRIAFSPKNPNNISLLLSFEEEHVEKQILDALLRQGIELEGSLEMEALCLPEPDMADQCCSSHHHDHSHHHHSHASHSHENHLGKAALGIAWGAGLLVLSIFSFTIPFLIYAGITCTTALATVYLGYNTFKSAWNNLLKNKLDTTTLYTISTLTIFLVSIASLFIPGLPLMLEAAPLILGFWHLGEAIEHALLSKINSKLTISDCLPSSAQLAGLQTKIPIYHLIPHDIITIQPGEVIPVDSILLQQASFYTTRLNGSPYPKRLQDGEYVRSGMQLCSNRPIDVQVSKTVQRSYLSLITKNIGDAKNKKAPAELFAEKLLKYFIPGLLSIALLSGLVISILFTPALAIHCVVSILVSACPCALSTITPLAVKIAMNKAAEQGIHYRDGQSLQAVCDIDTVVFDLNGTITQGEIHVSSFRVDPNYISYVLLLESKSEHPVARAIESYIKSIAQPMDESLVIASIDTSHHSGISAVINEKLMLIGTKDKLLAHGFSNFPPPYDNPDNGSVYIVHDQQLVGQIKVADPLRADAKHTITELKKRGYEVHLCTGADAETAHQYAKQLGIDLKHVAANTIGSASIKGSMSKADYIDLLKKQGHKVAMVGDAINDLEAIVHADAGIAIASSIGDAITQQEAALVIHKENVSPLVTAFELAKNTKRNIYQNLTISLTYNSAITLLASGLLLTIGFTLNPIVGVMCMIGESSIILANLYRLKQQKINSLSDFTRNTRFSNSSCEILHTLTASKSIHAEKKVAFQSPVEGPALFAKPLELATAACVRDQGPMSLDDVALKHSIHIHSFPIHRDIHRKCG